MRTPSGEEFRLFADDGWTLTRMTTKSTVTEADLWQWNLTQKLNGLYASTPHLEALKLLISDAAARTRDTFK